MAEIPDFLERTIQDFLGDVSAQTPAPAGGSVGAIAVALAAGLVEMAARFSREHWAEAGGAVAQAVALKERAAPLARTDAEAYAHALESFRLPKDGDPVRRDEAIGKALEQAAAIPLEIARLGTDVAVLAAEVAERGNPNLRGDAAAGAVLGEAGARIGANLVEINLGAAEGDERVAEARKLVAAAAAASRRVLGEAP